MCAVDKDDVDSRIGTTVGKYSITRLLGVGGMGRVYEGKHESLGKRFALKFIDRENVSEDAFARFEREAKAASSVESPHIVDVFDVGTTSDHLPYIVMELLRGEDLGQLIRRDGPLEVDIALRVVAQVLRGLVRAHEVGIVHRDLKPDNVFIVDRDDDECFIKILEFGVSKIPKENPSVRTLTREGVVLGTLVYMSPEQAQAMPDVDERSDLWAVGAILYECLAGQPAFTGATYESVIVSICTQDPPDLANRRADVPSGLKTIVEKALSRDRTQRFATAKEMLDALVIESNGVLPISMKSDSMKRPRAGSGTSSSGSSPGAMRSPGPATLGAVSTVAVTPEPLKPTTPGKGSRAPFAVGAIAIAAGGVFAGVWLSDDRTDGRGLRAVPSASAQTDPSAEASGVLSTPVASDSAPVNRAVASVTVEPAGSVAASATASAVATQTSKVRPPEVRSGAVSAVKTAAPTSTGGLGTGLQLKKE